MQELSDKHVMNFWNIGVSYFRAVTAIYEINQLNLYVGVCVKKDVNPFVIINIFISNCNLTTHFS